jgi:hypothetical protein
VGTPGQRCGSRATRVGDDQYVAPGFTQDAPGDAAEEQLFGQFGAVLADQDEVGAVFLLVGDDLLGGVAVGHKHRVAAGCDPGAGGKGVEMLQGVLAPPAPVGVDRGLSTPA